MQNKADYRSSLVSKPLTSLFCFSVNYLIVRKIQFLLCLARCHVIFLVMPALLHQRLRALQQALYVGSLKILSSMILPSLSNCGVPISC